MKDAAEHRGMRVLAWLIVIAIAGSGAVVQLLMRADEREDDVRPAVSIGARCPEHGAEDRTYDGAPVHCASFPSHDMQVWSVSPRDLSDLPAAWDREALGVPAEYRAQVRLCMSQSGNGDRACHAAIVRTEQEQGLGP